jgi:hypothetical protein
MGLRGVAIVVGVMVALGQVAAAEVRPNPALEGRIVLSDRGFPKRGRNLAAYNAQVAKQGRTSFVEDRQWKIHYAAFLRAPLAGTRYVVKLYEHGDGRRRLLLAIKKTAEAPGLTTLASELTMQGAPLGTNKRLLMTIESGGDVLGEAWFEVLGAAPAAETEDQ